jgi:hypothetical protein
MTSKLRDPLEDIVKRLACVFALTVGVAACSGAKAPENTLTTPAGTSGNAPISADTSTPAAAPAPGAPAAAVSPAVAQYQEVTIPSGTTLRLSLQTSVASDTSHVEEPVRATLRTPVTVNGRDVLPAGSEVTGVVTSANQSGRVKGRANVAFRFNSVHAAGETYNIQTSSIGETARATKKKDATKIGIGAGAGAALGALLGGGKGAAKGAAIGGAGGTGVVLATRGEEVRLGPGAAVTTRLTAPVTVRVKL